MDEEVTTSFWISFFVEAGIPPAAAANYAIIFTDNRIQKHMLLDLNKEYLKDMGVNVLGDIIAILKHSKRYHEKVAREKVLAIDKETSVMKATKHLNEILLKDEVKTIDVQPPLVTQSKTASGPSPPKKLKTAKLEVIKKDTEDDFRTEVTEELKRKVIAPKLQNKTQTASVAAAKVVKKSSVFDRLGESNVTSTTPEIVEPAKKAPSVTSIKAQQGSVFRRLGGVQETKEPSVSVKVSSATSLTKTTIKKTFSKPSDIPDAGKSSLRMDMESASSKQSARERLGLDKPNVTKISVVSTKAPTRTVLSSKDLQQKRIPRPLLTTPLAAKNPGGVKQRLGSAVTKTNTPTSSSSVFNRLGLNRK